MKKFSKTFWLIALLSFLASLLLFWRLFFYQPQEKPQVVLPTPTPPAKTTPTLLPSQSQGDSQRQVMEAVLEKFPLAPFLPYQTARFRIDYQAPLTLKVSLLVPQTKTIEEEVSNWIETKGVVPATHQIEWFTPAP